MPRSQSKDRVPEADVLRALACCVVVLIHLAVTATRFEAAASPALYALEPLYQLSLWATPTFAVLSGFVLRAVHPAAPEPRSFWSKRLPSVWMPLLGWASVYALLFSPPFGTVQYAAGFLLGQVGQGHLYFAAMVLQFYALYPWIWRWIEHRQSGRILAAAFLVALAYQSVFSYMPRPAGATAFFWDASKSLLPGWLFYFLLGSLAARHRERIGAWCASRRLAACVAAVGAVGLLLWEYYCGPTPAGGTGSCRPVVVLYSALMLPALWLVAGRIAASPLYVPARYLSARSYGIYLVHPLCLQLVSTAFPTSGLGARLLVFALGTVGGTTLLLAIASQSALGRRLAGLPGTSAATALPGGSGRLASAAAG